MPAENIGVIDLLADDESFDEARLPISPEVDDKWRGRAITGAGLLKFASTALVLTGTAEPTTSLLTAGRRALYFRKDSEGDIIELHVSLEGTAWKEVSTGTDVSVQYAETDSTSDSDWHDTQGNSDAYMRFIIGETTLPAIFIGRPDDGEDGDDGDHGGSARIVYIRSENEPSAPTGSYTEADGLSLDGSWQETVPTVVGGDHDSAQSFSLHSDNDRAAGIARYDGQSYVVNNAFDADPGENKFFIYDDNNDYVSDHALHTDNDNPSAIAISPDGTKLFVLDSEAEQVYRYNPSTGAYVSHFDLPTGLSGSGLDVDADYIYVLNSSVKRVHVFEHDGTAHTDKNRELPISGFHAYRGYVFHGGRDYVLNSTGSTHEVRAYKDGDHLSDDGQNLASGNTVGYGLEIDEGKLFITDRSDNEVYVYAGAVEHPLYGSGATINRNDEDVEFSAPFLMEGMDGEDGEPGADGADGKFRVTLYQNATSAPSAPTTITYTFATEVLGSLGSWSETRETVSTGESTYVIEAVVDPDTDDASVTLSFNTPVNITAEDGEDGDDGDQGPQGRFYVRLYQNATTRPSAPTTITYTFATEALANLGDWSVTRTEVTGDENTYVIEDVVDPNTDDASVTLSFDTPVNVTTVAAVPEQREESVTFQAVTTDITYGTDAAAMLTAASNPVAVAYPTGETEGEILSVATAGEAAITVLKKGVYFAVVEGDINISAARVYFYLHIYNNDDTIGTDTPIDRLGGDYYREDSDDMPVLATGKLTITEDDTVIKCVPSAEYPSVLPTNTGNPVPMFTIDAGMKLTLIPLGGTRGEDGEDGTGSGTVTEITEANITDEDSSTAGGVSGRRAKAAVGAFGPDTDHYHLSFDRTLATGGSGDSLSNTTHVHFYQHSGDEWEINIAEHTDFPADFLEHLQTNVQMRLVSGDKVWRGHISHLVDTSASGAVIRIDFDIEQTGTFANGDTITITFGYSPASISLTPDNRTIQGKGTHQNKFRLKTANALGSGNDGQVFVYNHGSSRLDPVHLERMATFYFRGQNARLPITSTTLPTGHAVVANGVKPLKSATPDETHNGGIGTCTLGNLNSASNSPDATPDVANTFITVPAGLYHIRMKGRGDQYLSATPYLILAKATSGTDDVVLVDTPGYTGFVDDGTITHRDLRTHYSDEEKYIEIEADDELYVRLVDYDSGEDTLVGYLQFIRIHENS